MHAIVEPGTDLCTDSFKGLLARPKLMSRYAKFNGCKLCVCRKLTIAAFTVMVQFGCSVCECYALKGQFALWTVLSPIGA